jgi:hypothetical protein
MLDTHVGKLLLDDALPEDLRQEKYNFDKKGMHSLLQQVAERYPDRYKEILKKLSDIGRDSVYTTGTSVSLSGLQSSPAKEAILGDAKRYLQTVTESTKMSDDQKEKAIVDTLLPLGPKLQDALFEEAKQEDNPYYLQLISGARGKKSDYNSLRGADLLTSDQNGKIIPIPILNSYADGLDPVEYWAGLYGQRKAAITTKFCLAGDTLIRMADFSVKPIRDVVPGEFVLGSGMDGVLTPTRVVKRWDNGLRPCYRYTFRQGSSTNFVSLVATEEHKVLGRLRCSVPLGVDAGTTLRPLSDGRLYRDTQKNTFVAEPVRGFGASTGQSEPYALLLGLMLGDGCVSPTARNPLFSCADQLLLDEIAPMLMGLNAKLVKCSTEPKQFTYIFSQAVPVPRQMLQGSDGRILGGVRQNQVWLLCERYGMIGQYAFEKTLPTNVDQWDNTSVAQLLAGLFVTDGCVRRSTSGRPHISFTSTSEVMVRKVADLLLWRFGIWSTINFIKIRGNMRHPQWTLHITQPEAIEAFRATIPLIGKKRLTLASIPPAPSGRLGLGMFSKTSVGMVETFDLEVEHPNHAFALANGLISANSTGDSGYLSKRLVNAAHRLVVDKATPEPTRVLTGLPVSPKDKDSVGAVLAKDAGPYKAGQLLTEKMLKDIDATGADEIVIHSPMAEQSPDGGVSQLAAGRRDRFGLSHIGDNIGVPAAQAIGEKLSQSNLSSKHSSGVTGTGPNRAGFEVLNRMVEAPEHFPESGPLAEKDGMVENIEDAPQGGRYITAGGHRHYAHPEVTPTVKIGDRVEAGDSLTDGLPHPSDLVRHKGIGEARRIYLGHMKEVLENSSVPTHRRNLEAVVSGLINQAIITNPDGIGEHVVDDVVSYNQMAHQYTPRPDAKLAPAKQAIGQYLEENALHYTIGTKVTKGVAKHLEKHGIKDVYTHEQPPGFEAYHQRGIMLGHSDPDWKVGLSGFYVAGGFHKALSRGAVSDPNSTSYVPGLSAGTDFGKHLKTTGHYGPAAPPHLGLTD